jgi:hypothetical protein
MPGLVFAFEAKYGIACTSALKELCAVSRETVLYLAFPALLLFSMSNEYSLDFDRPQGA